MQKLGLLLAVAFLMTACAGAFPGNPQNYAGIARYEVEPVIEEMPDGTPVIFCCEWHITDGKEAQDIDLKVTGIGTDGMTVSFTAKGVEAFEGQMIRGEVEKVVAEQFRIVVPDIIKGIIEGIKPLVVGP